ncbi:hypothetical protein [Spirosoma flavum]|uniref:DUF4129 domain-containing protein n=1 Tax=Spirosoma flavum TaxID=2048557 RepID=A0ABW6AB08_9BACT
MKPGIIIFLVFFSLLTVSGQAQITLQQSPVQQSPLGGHFLVDSIEIGRPFRYALTYRHSPTTDVLFPDTARHFAPYRVQKVAVFATKTSGTGPMAISRDSAVYTLVSFETESIQALRVPIRVINDIDCTAQWTQTDTVFLRSKLPRALPNSLAPQSHTLATETTLAPLQQQFNYVSLAIGFIGIALIISLLYLLFGKLARRQWRLYLFNRRHIRFLREYTLLNERISPFTAAETANQAVVMWKTYLEQLDPQPYISLTTPELADRLRDQRVTNALREADQMIYGGTFTPQSQAALQVLSDVATQIYLRGRTNLLRPDSQRDEIISQANSAEPSSLF